MQADPSVVIIDEPTRGIDIGNENQIFRFIDDLVRVVGANTAKWLVEQLGGTGEFVVLRGIPTMIDDERIKGL
ncbi:hypothetical protein [Pseudooceanicola sp.]|uniref:hypothetical protein n=1 Tax=Pseudooceanicola sp. TaxID=1914328 RepID=UPI0040587794